MSDGLCLNRSHFKRTPAQHAPAPTRLCIAPRADNPAEIDLASNRAALEPHMWSIEKCKIGDVDEALAFTNFRLALFRHLHGVEYDELAFTIAKDDVDHGLERIPVIKIVIKQDDDVIFEVLPVHEGDSIVGV